MAKISLRQKYEIEYINGRNFDHYQCLDEVFTGDVIKEELIAAIEKGKSAIDLMSAFSARSKKPDVVLHEVAATELQNAHCWGFAKEFHEKYGDAIRFYKEPSERCCIDCKNLYLTNGPGSEPRTFTYEEMVANGSNLRRKRHHRLPTIGVVHSCCKCPIYAVQTGQQWDAQRKEFR